MLDLPNDQPARVLIVEDDAIQLSALASMLGDSYSLQVARSGEQALRLAKNTPPDLILLDQEMPGLTGTDVCQQLKRDPATANVPVVILTSHHDEASELHALGCGAADFVAKPPRASIVRARVANLLRMKLLAERLRRQAITDGLTGLPNRAQFDAILRMEWQRALRSGRDLALLMVDVDCFKAYNDRHGHLAGDDALRQVARALRAVVRRPADLVARFGGE